MDAFFDCESLFPDVSSSQPRLAITTCIYPRTFPYIPPPISPPIHPSTHLTTYPIMCPPIYHLIHDCSFSSIQPNTHPSIQPASQTSIHPSIHLSLCPSVACFSFHSCRQDAEWEESENYWECERRRDWLKPLIP